MCSACVQSRSIFRLNRTQAVRPLKQASAEWWHLRPGKNALQGGWRTENMRECCLHHGPTTEEAMCAGRRQLPLGRCADLRRGRGTVYRDLLGWLALRRDGEAG